MHGARRAHARVFFFRSDGKIRDLCYEMSGLSKLPLTWPGHFYSPNKTENERGDEKEEGKEEKLADAGSR